MNRPSVSMLALAVLLLSLTGNTCAEHVYEAHMLPSDASPAWRTVIDHNRSAQRFVWANDGLLTVHTPESHDNIAWSVGSWAGKDGTDVFRIEPQKGATVDVRLRVVESSATGVFQLQVSDGRTYWTVFFHPAHILVHRGKSGAQSTRVRYDNTSFNTFRFAILGERASLYVAGRDDPLIADAAPSGTHGKTPRHALTFGDFNSGANGRFDLKSVRWSTEIAEFRPPSTTEATETEKAVANLTTLRRRWAKTTGGPSVLFMGYRHHAYTGAASRRLFLRDLALKHGFRVTFRHQEFGFRNQPAEFEPAEFDNYDVIVYLSPPWSRTDEKRLTDTFTKQWAAALRFVDRGGGLLFMPHVGETYQFTIQQCFASLGLEPLAAIPVEPAPVSATVMQIRWSYTDRLDNDHPITKGVRGLWLPAYGDKAREIWNANSTAVRVSDAWDVIARFGDAVQFRPFEFHGVGRQFSEPGERDQRSKPLLAIRSHGKGRIAFFALDSAFHIVGGRAPGYEGIFLSNGVKGIPSDGETLVVNTLNWLGAVARTGDDLGGALTDPASVSDSTFKPSPKLTEPQGFAAPRPGYKGAIGALSPRSGGKSSVAEYAARAQEIGLDFLVVLDDLDQIDAKQLAQLNTEAKSASTSEFTCIPGLRFRDESGNRFVAFRNALLYPTDAMLRPNRRFRTVIRKKERSSGTSGLGLAQWMQSNGHRCAVVHYRDPKDRLSDDPYEYGVPPWDVRPYRQFHSVFTHDVDGNLIDDMVEEHKVVVDDGQHPHPVAITFMDEAADLDRIADGTLPHTVRWTADFSTFGANTGEEPEYLPTSYATQGPVIERWQWDSRDLVNNGTYWDWTYYQQRWGLDVTSDVGLKTVEIWDGKELIRRWHPGGAQAFSKTITVNKHQLTMPLVIATDIEGKRAVTDGFQWRSHNFYVSWCSDRVNTLSYSALPSKESPWGHSGGTWCVTTQAKGPIWDNLRLDVNLDILRFPGFDGQAGGGAFSSPVFYVHAAEGQPRDGRLYRHITWPLGSQEVVIQEQVFEHQLVPEQTGPHGWSTCGPIVPTDVLEGKMRYTTFVHWGHAPAPILVEAEMRFKQDVTTSDSRPALTINNLTGGNRSAAYAGVAVQGTGTHDRAYPICHDRRDHHVATGPLPPGAYVWFYPSTFGPFGTIALSDDLSYRVSVQPTTRNAQLRLGKPGQVFRKGDVVRWRYLAVTSGFNDSTGIDTPRRIVDLLGIDGKPGYTVTPQQGTVTDTTYMLTVSPSPGEGGFRGTIEPNEDVRLHGLPTALPLVAENMNDRWTAVLWDKGQGAARPIPVAEGKAYAHYRELRKPITLFIGHPFVCDDPEVHITVVQTGDMSFYVQGHNPTDQPRTVTIRSSEGCTWLPQIDAKPIQWTWALPPGGDREEHLGEPTPFTPAMAEE